MRRELEPILARLLAATETEREVTLDALGEAIGTAAISSEEIDEMMALLETKGRRIVGPEGGGGEARLREVVTTARILTTELGRRPTVLEIAERSRMAVEDVRHALALARVMQR